MRVSECYDWFNMCILYYYYYFFIHHVTYEICHSNTALAYVYHVEFNFVLFFFLLYTIAAGVASADA